MSNTGDGSWGHLSGTEHFGRKSCSSDYVTLKLEDTNLPQYKNCTRAGHCMIYSKQYDKIFGIYDPRAAIMMQMRFDGYIGFPGGLIDGEESEDTITGLNRELVEEVHLDVEKYPVKDEHYIISHWNEKENLLLHFYAIEVSLKDFEAIEKNVLLAHDYGTEVLGVIRVPLYTMGDGYRGFPAFLSNAFAGNSREQLLHSLVQRQILSQEEVRKALNVKPV